MPFIIDQTSCRGTDSPFFYNHPSTTATQSKMPSFGSLMNKLTRKDSNRSASRTASFRSNKSNNSTTMGPTNPFTTTYSTPTRRPTSQHPDTANSESAGAPPPYTAAAAAGPSRPAAHDAFASSSTSLFSPSRPSADDPYAFLSTFDTIFLIDDSGSMAGRSWRETSAALRTIAPICTAHDADGIDVYFLNTPSAPSHRNIKSAATIGDIFSTVRPHGGTPTGTRLNQILKPYLARLERLGEDAVKPLNIIVVTDGVPSDDVESVVINAARKLDRWDVPAWQVGIQFFQVGTEAGAAEMLRSLDDDLADLSGGARDIVDTVPWNGVAGAPGLDGEGILKVVLGAVNKRLDRKAVGGGKPAPAGRGR